jgi:hypothetical protein
MPLLLEDSSGSGGGLENIPTSRCSQMGEAAADPSGGAKKEPETVVQSASEASTGDIPEGRIFRYGGHVLRLGSARVAQDSLGGYAQRGSTGQIH